MLAKKTAKPDEQTVLLREILAELRRLNANLERRSAAPPPQDIEESDLDEDSEELEYFE